MKTLFTIIAAAFLLVGCASGQYEAYATAQAAAAQARANAEAERYRALAKIAETGSDTARVAAVMSIAGLGGGAQPAQQIAAPVDRSTQALQWASVLVPGITQAYLIGQNTKLGMRQSDNAAATSQATTAGFVGIASKIQAPAPNVTLSGAGVIGSGTYSIGPNSGYGSGNSGKWSAGALTDQTSTPTVVQPTTTTP